MIEKNYQPADIESRMSRIWEESGAFKAGRPERRDAAPFTIVIPPPNVTGSLHMGHALNNTLQDILCRFERMRGRDVLWQPGTDHAGIATQMVVERQLMERQEPGRRDMGRAKFLERVWQWKAESGGVIVNQLKRLGASCDWSRERFTMDEGLSRAVVKVFVELHRDGLIYKDKRLVNWDPKLVTAISDLEVQQVEVKGSLWYLRYPIEGKTFSPDDPSTFVVVATTRPETMLGDTAVAIHPENERIGHLIGQHVILPLVGRRIPIIGDDYADPEKGSGAVKITPAHDFNDFEVGKRHGLPQINVFDREGSLALIDNKDYLRGLPEGAGQLAEELHNVDRFAARKKLVTRLEDFGFLEKIEPNTHMVPHGDRSGVVIEPYLTDQWYVDAKTMAQPAIAAVRSGATAFVPKNWENTYFEWMENIQPWCISRQLWWGHQIPAWYGPYLQDGRISYELGDGGKNNVFVAHSEEEARLNAEKFYNKPTEFLSSWSELTRSDVISNMKADNRVIYLWRDPDVLDTWFSSGLWPFSTLGWPDDTSEVKRYYPTNTLVTGFDIIFFWVARMMMMGLHFMKEIPFSTIYIHALVRDEKGAKMSKSKGNVIDPLHLVDEYGADALRFTLAAMAAQGRDIKLSESRVDGYRSFATKLWNAARFVEFNGASRVANFDPKGNREALNRWIVGKTAEAARTITSAIENYEFNAAAQAAYQFVWNIYCDWYVELSKPLLGGPDGVAKEETRATAAWVLDEILKLLHPFMPFITEELWHVTGERGPTREGLLTLTTWPDLKKLEHLVSPSEPKFDVVIQVVSEVRTIRTELNIASKNITSIELSNFGAADSDILDATLPSIARLVRARTRLVTSSGAASEAQPASKLEADEVVTVDVDVPWSLNEAPISTAASDLVVRSPVGGGMLAINVRAFDIDKERGRLGKALGQVDADIKRVDAKLSNEKFVANAPEEIVEEEKEKREAAVARKEKILEALDRLKNAS
jgi:valyl-tRNA synthetase